MKLFSIGDKIIYNPKSKKWFTPEEFKTKCFYNWIFLFFYFLFFKEHFD